MTTPPLNYLNDHRVNTLISIDDTWERIQNVKDSFAKVVEGANKYHFALREINDVVTAMLSIPNTSVAIHARELKDILDEVL